MAPMATFMLSLVTRAVVPFYYGMVLSDPNIRLLYLFAISSLGVYGIIRAGITDLEAPSSIRLELNENNWSVKGRLKDKKWKRRQSLDAINLSSSGNAIKSLFHAAYSVFGLTIDSIATRAYSFLCKRAFDAYSFLNKGKKKRAKTSTTPVAEKAPTPSAFSEIAAETASYIAPIPYPSSGTKIATSLRLAYD
ncbi:hypothetical protein Syun_001400 [Stephania yunnanensis]|uniref:Uncharacterized protein n=1 Tax=Stephania yunnanensis TaxID=152371 RepID=A0AAP0LGK7_9MAGN